MKQYLKRKKEQTTLINKLFPQNELGWRKVILGVFCCVFILSLDTYWRSCAGFSCNIEFQVYFIVASASVFFGFLISFLCFLYIKRFKNFLKIIDNILSKINISLQSFYNFKKSYPTISLYIIRASLMAVFYLVVVAIYNNEYIQSVITNSLQPKEEIGQGGSNTAFETFNYLSLIIGGLTIYAVYYARGAYLLQKKLIREQKEDSMKNQIRASWEIIGRKAVGNSGKIEAIEFLATQGIKLIGLDMSSKTHGGLEGEKKEDRVYLQALDVSLKTLAYKVNLKNSNFTGADLDSSNFAGADLEYSNFERARLGNSNFEEAYLWSSHFKGAYLPRSNFKGAGLMGSNFTRALLIHSNFTGADLECSIFARADLEHSNFEGACLGNSNFEEAEYTLEAIFGYNYIDEINNLPKFDRIEVEIIEEYQKYRKSTEEEKVQIDKLLENETDAKKINELKWKKYLREDLQGSYQKIKITKLNK